MLANLLKNILNKPQAAPVKQKVDESMLHQQMALPEKEPVKKPEAAPAGQQVAENIFRQQIACPEQKLILRALAGSVARPGMNTLEVGSWCGDSAVEIGAVVKQFGGKHFCVDWWKGNVSTHLEDVAQRVDIFNEFWKRMVEEGLDDTIIPIRGKSDDVARILAKEGFDMVYIDGDHVYDQARRDIGNYVHLVRDHGLLCGDDCEGRLTDFDREFIDRGLATDYYETVHCGVVLAVGEHFDDYSVDYNIWSVRRNGASWTPTNLALPGIEPRRQYSPPLIESYKQHNLIRYGRKVWALPWARGFMDVTREADRNSAGVLSAGSISELRALIDAGAP